MIKKIIVGVVLLLIVLVGWYLISPLFITTELNEDSPIDSDGSFKSMSAEEKAEFDDAVESMKDVLMESDESMDLGAQVLKESLFIEDAHGVEGKAILIDDEGEKIVRFEDFETVNGPNLHIYLASDLGGEDYVDLGEIKATKGNVNYDVPDGTDLEKYNKVLVWCVPFKVLFSYADLS